MYLRPKKTIFSPPQPWFSDRIPSLHLNICDLRSSSGHSFAMTLFLDVRVRQNYEQHDNSDTSPASQQTEASKIHERPVNMAVHSENSPYDYFTALFSGGMRKICSELHDTQQPGY
jgi:hypothetical protein